MIILPTEPVTDPLVIERTRDTVWLRANLRLINLELDALFTETDANPVDEHHPIWAVVDDAIHAWHDCADRLTDFDYPRPLWTERS